MAAAIPACGGEAPAQDQPVEPAESPPLAEHLLANPVADPAGRTVVAEINGVPVYDDCVATQAAAHGLDRRAGLDECIAFELLAQEAAARGLAADPEVRRSQKTEAVRRLIDAAFVSRYPDPEAMDRALLEEAYDKLRSQRYFRPEVRYTAHALARLENEPEGTPADQAAEALARAIYEAVKDLRDLSPEEFFRIAEETAGEQAILNEGPFPLHRTSNLAKSFIEATFALPGTGMVSPPVRSHVGWHVILLTRIDPELNVSLEEAKAELFQYQRARLYMDWVAGLFQGTRILVDEAALAWLQENEDRERFADPSSP